LHRAFLHGGVDFQLVGFEALAIMALFFDEKVGS